MLFSESVRNQKSKIEPSFRELLLWRWHLVYLKGFNLLKLGIFEMMLQI